PLADPDGRRPRPGGDRRAVLALVAGLAVLALALGGLTYALLHRGGGGDGGARSSGGPDGVTPSPTASAGRTETGGGPAPSASASSSSTPPPQSVTVALSGAHTAYSGTCPPPGEEAPAFTATFTVGRLPAEVSYRWVLKSGEVSDPGWRTLSFSSEGGKSRQDTVRVTAYAQDGTFENTVGVEVRSPVRVVPDAVPFSVTCVTETPTGGASASATASASP
ncbi:serine/threonine protein kinase, partial [Streptomyces sp. NTH33]